MASRRWVLHDGHEPVAELCAAYPQLTEEPSFVPQVYAAQNWDEVAIVREDESLAGLLDLWANVLGVTVDQPWEGEKEGRAQTDGLVQRWIAIPLRPNPGWGQPFLLWPFQ